MLISKNTNDTNTNTDTNQFPITSGENPQPGSTVHDLPVEPAAAVARKDLACSVCTGFIF